jgi:hypothetical protein
MANTTHQLVLPSLEPRKLIVANKATSRSNQACAWIAFGSGFFLMMNQQAAHHGFHGQRMP